jgi:hypothetical protein
MRITTYGLLPVKMKEARVDGVVIHHTLDAGFLAVFAVETQDSFWLTSEKTLEEARLYCRKNHLKRTSFFFFYFGV